jgi:hypothetical protein
LRSVVAGGVEGLLEPGYRGRRAKDPEHLSSGRRLQCQPYSPPGSHLGYVLCRALPVGAGAPTLEPVGHEAHNAAADDEAAAGKSPAVPAGGSEGEHTVLVGPSVLAL